MPSFPPPSSSVPDDLINQYEGARLLAVSIAFIVILTLVLMLRLFCRFRLQVTRFGWDDGLIACAWFCNVGASAVGIASVSFGAAGHHVQYINLHYPDKLWNFKRCTYAATWFYYSAIMFAKLSVLAMYLRLFGVNKQTRYIIYSLMGLVICICLAYVLASATICIPAKANWNITIDGRCGDIVALNRSASIPSIVSDLLIMAVPVPIIMKLRVNHVQKFAILFTFATALLGTAACAVRMVVFFTRGGTPDITWTAASLWSWEVIEPGMYFIAACMPVFRPLFPFLNPRRASNRLSTWFSPQSSKRKTTSTNTTTNNTTSVSNIYHLDGNTSLAYTEEEIAEFTSGLTTLPMSIPASRRDSMIEKLQNMGPIAGTSGEAEGRAFSTSDFSSLRIAKSSNNGDSRQQSLVGREGGYSGSFASQGGRRTSSRPWGSFMTDQIMMTREVWTFEDNQEEKGP